MVFWTNYWFLAQTNFNHIQACKEQKEGTFASNNGTNLFKDLQIWNSIHNPNEEETKMTSKSFRY